MAGFHLRRRRAGFFILLFLFFWRLFAWREVDRLWLPDGDLTQQYFPLREIAAREIAAGRLPLWNPYMFAGQPGLADSQMAALYPINFISALILGWLNRPFTLAVFQLQIVLHYALAALFTFAFAYRLTRSRFAAWVAALTSGPRVDPHSVPDPWNYADPSTWIGKPPLDMILVAPDDDKADLQKAAATPV